MEYWTPFYYPNYYLILPLVIIWFFSTIAYKGGKVSKKTIFTFLPIIFLLFFIAKDLYIKDLSVLSLIIIDSYISSAFNLLHLFFFHFVILFIIIYSISKLKYLSNLTHKFKDNFKFLTKFSIISYMLALLVTLCYYPIIQLNKAYIKFKNIDIIKIIFCFILVIAIILSLWKIYNIFIKDYNKKSLLFYFNLFLLYSFLYFLFLFSFYGVFNTIISITWYIIILIFIYSAYFVEKEKYYKIFIIINSIFMIMSTLFFFFQDSMPIFLLQLALSRLTYPIYPILQKLVLFPILIISFHKIFVYLKYKSYNISHINKFFVFLSLISTYILLFFIFLLYLVSLPVIVVFVIMDVSATESFYSNIFAILLLLFFIIIYPYIKYKIYKKYNLSFSTIYEPENTNKLLMYNYNIILELVIVFNICIIASLFYKI